MVDFQSRDARRSHGGGAADEASDDGTPADGESGGGDATDEDAGARGDHASAHDHPHDHDAPVTLGFGVVTVTSSRSVAEDASGDTIVSLVEAEDHEVVTRELVGDDYDRVQDVVDNLVGRSDVDAVVTTGGTGVTPDDVTVEAVTPLVDKHLPGFGELFRARSREEVGTKVIATRATAGVAEGVPVFCLPGSESAVELGVREVILPEVSHLVALARREDE
ncbi:MAG: molybdenum cofactor biosynthesis protein B [Halobacteriaceae archaeon]